jgi:adenine-specific DNA methylase
MSITTTVITVKTNTLTTSSRRNNRRWGKWHGSSRTSRRRTNSRKASNQDSSRLQKTSITKTNLLITNRSESVHQGDIGATSKQLDTKRLKLITKPSQKVVGPTKLKYNHLISAGLTSGMRQLRAKSVKLTPNNRKLIKEVINCSVTLSNKLLLANSSKIGRLSNILILLTKKRPYLMSPL